MKKKAVGAEDGSKVVEGEKEPPKKKSKAGSSQSHEVEAGEQDEEEETLVRNRGLVDHRLPQVRMPKNLKLSAMYPGFSSPLMIKKGS